MALQILITTACLLLIMGGLSVADSVEENTINDNNITTKAGIDDPVPYLHHSHPHPHPYPHPHLHPDNDKYNETQEGCGLLNIDGIGTKNSTLQHNETQFGEFPWMAAISREDTINNDTKSTVYICSGTVIAPKVILTAAHCVRGLEPQTLVVRVGEWDLLTAEESLPHQDARVKEIVVHEHYLKELLFNDIALLMLETPFHWAPNVRPICLPPPGLSYDDARCFVTGWNKEPNQATDGSSRRLLMKIEVPVVARRICQAKMRTSRLGRHFQLHESFMCAGGERSEYSCLNDGGAPLVCPDPFNSRRFFQAGLVAWGMSCSREDFPGVYTNVKHLRPWMNEKLWSRGVDFIHFTA